MTNWIQNPQDIKFAPWVSNKLGTRTFLKASPDTFVFINPREVSNLREPFRGGGPTGGGLTPYKVMRDYKGEATGCLFISSIEANIFFTPSNGGWETGCAVLNILKPGMDIVIIPGVNSTKGIFGVRYVLQSVIDRS